MNNIKDKRCKLSMDNIEETKQLPSKGGFKRVEDRGEVFALCEGIKLLEPFEWFYREVYFDKQRGWILTVMYDNYTNTPVLGYWAVGLWKRRTIWEFNKSKQKKVRKKVIIDDNYYVEMIEDTIGFALILEFRKWYKEWKNGTNRLPHDCVTKDQTD